MRSIYETMLRLVLGLVAIFGFVGEVDCADGVSFPSKPIRLVVYTKPGGAIDTTARKFADVAAQYVDATFVVENKPGAGGIVAMKDVLQSKADGYTLLACTKSNVAKIVATGDATLIEAFHWVGMMMADPECVITRRDIGPSTWAELVADAEAKDGRQVWAGPAFGGLDHVTAMKAWEKSGIKAVWVPFQSGGKAKAELLGGRSVAYVGNPSEVRANPDKLMVAAVASASRLSQFPDVPTFAELGLDGLEQEFMWRGFALRNGVEPQIVAWYEDLFRKVSADEQWRAFYEKDGIDVAFHDSQTFTTTVRGDHKDFTTYLGQLGILNSDTPAAMSRFLNSWYPLVGLCLLCSVIGAGLRRRRRHTDGDSLEAHSTGKGPSAGKTSGDVGESIIPIAFLLLGVLLFLVTRTFPVSDQVGAAAVPRLWLAALLPLSVVLLVRSFLGRQELDGSARVAREPSVHNDPSVAFRSAKVASTALFRGAKGDNHCSNDPNGFAVVAPLFGLLLVYVLALVWLGYYISTFLFLLVAMVLMGERGPLRLAGVAVGWLAFSYLVFARLLFVPLPIGKLIERFY